MAYEKRVCVLKQIKKGFSADGAALTGAVYAERLGTTLTLSVKVPAAPLSGGRYCLAVWINAQTYCFEYQNTIVLEHAPSLASGFSALLLFVKGEAEPIAYGGCGEAPRDYTALLSVVNRMQPPAEKNREQKDREPAEDESASASFRTKYDDEAIAATDYFTLRKSDEDDGAQSGGEEAEEKAGTGSRENANTAAHLLPRGSLAYYREVKEKLDEVFAKFPQDERLKAVFPASEWVNSNGALLGILYENGTPRYLCVAVEANGEPPEEMKERGVFVPRTQFSDEEGFFVVFQDADTGEYVRVYDA